MNESEKINKMARENGLRVKDVIEILSNMPQDALVYSGGWPPRYLGPLFKSDIVCKKSYLGGCKGNEKYEQRVWLDEDRGWYNHLEESLSSLTKDSEDQTTIEEDMMEVLIGDE